ncbi:MAG TPA: NAD(P)H-hydrate epimerase [Elusimicrobia bacterium]|nr:NAD(P)H-hydrate epimerase [Elusimicrobiota bacterium]HBT60967.1 NAD(P)H-hydrate epimerase [Elusimicrobiota bacterium]
MPKEPLPATYQGLPLVTAQRMREIDGLSTQKYGLKVIDLMENAGRAVAAQTVVFLSTLGLELKASHVAACCGRGANGGDGLVAARLLKQGGAEVEVFICSPKKEAGQPGEYPEPVRVNLERAKALGIAVNLAEDEAALQQGLGRADVVLDGLLGTGSSGKPAGSVHKVIQAITRSKKPVVAIDLPSGIHPDTGYHSGVYVTAALTLTLGLPKRGLVTPHARKYVGELKVLDIGFPKELMR